MISQHRPTSPPQVLKPPIRNGKRLTPDTIACCCKGPPEAHRCLHPRRELLHRSQCRPLYELQPQSPLSPSHSAGPAAAREDVSATLAAVQRHPGFYPVLIEQNACHVKNCGICSLVFPCSICHQIQTRLFWPRSVSACAQAAHRFSQARGVPTCGSANLTWDIRSCTGKQELFRTRSGGQAKTHHNIKSKSPMDGSAVVVLG